MSDDLKTIVPEQEVAQATPQVEVTENMEEIAPVAEEAEASVQESGAEQEIDLSGKGLKELVDLFQQMLEEGDVQKLYKYAEGIKALFYKTLKKEKIAIGYQAPLDDAAVEAEVEAEAEQAEQQVSANPFAELERGFKDLYAKYKTLRTDYVQELNKKKDENYAVKSEVIESLKALVENPSDISKAYPQFRELQAKWRSAGAVPPAKAKDLYETYSHYVEVFYDYVKINREFRDLDFKKNLEAKEVLCEKAEALVNEADVVGAFRTLQKLHEQWKEIGPVDKEHREVIWERFKAATAAINKNHQEYFEVQKGNFKQNLEAKTVLCEKAEAIAAVQITDSSKWSEYAKQLDELQKEWRTIGFASKKDNQKIYDRFRAACDAFYTAKRNFYSEYKGQIQDNLAKKTALCEQAEAIMNSEDWKKTAETLVDLQRQWKEIGPVNRKKSEALWKRFRAACDTFFDNRDKNATGKDSSYSANLAAKRALIEEINNYEGDDAEAMESFRSRWSQIGFVPFKVKEEIQKAYAEAMAAKFGEAVSERPARRGRDARPVKHLSEKDRLIQQFLKMEQDIATWENNMGFFAKSKNADAILADLNKKIEVAKSELSMLEEKIKSFEKQSEE